MTAPSNEWNDALKDVLARAASDADFRAKCLSNPEGALREAGVEVPSGTPIVFSGNGQVPSCTH